MKRTEPCLCGATDCPECTIGVYKCRRCRKSVEGSETCDLCKETEEYLAEEEYYRKYYDYYE